MIVWLCIINEVGTYNEANNCEKQVIRIYAQQHTDANKHIEMIADSKNVFMCSYHRMVYIYTYIYTYMLTRAYVLHTISIWK